MSSMPAVAIGSSVNGSDEWVPNCDDRTLVPRLGMVFNRFEDCLEFYRRYAVYVGFSVRSGPTRKNKAGKCWKRYVCSKEGFRQPSHISTIPTSTVEAIAQLTDDIEGAKLMRKRAEMRKGCQAHVLLRSTDDEKFEIIKFHEGHVHLLCTPSRRQFLSSNRNVSSV